MSTSRTGTAEANQNVKREHCPQPKRWRPVYRSVISRLRNVRGVGALGYLWVTIRDAIL